MAATYGSLYGSKGKRETGRVTRSGDRYVASILRTWDGKAETTVWKDGRCTLEVNGKVVWEGNINEDGTGASKVNLPVVGGGGTNMAEVF